jgi:hypothetical protein
LGPQLHRDCIALRVAAGNKFGEAGDKALSEAWLRNALIEELRFLPKDQTNDAERGSRFCAWAPLGWDRVRNGVL